LFDGCRLCFRLQLFAKAVIAASRENRSAMRALRSAARSSARLELYRWGEPVSPQQRLP
jgi:hypothetical protein